MATGKLRSVDPTRFAMVPRADVPRSAFDIQHGHKTTFDAGYLIPVYVDEVLPGDSHRVKMTAFCRLATPLVPIMDNLIMQSFFFFVPNRLVWDNWERFMGEQTSPSDTTVFLTPQVTLTEAQVEPHTLADYFGITIQAVTGAKVLSVSAFPFRAYNLIWNTWFKDQDLGTPATILAGDGPDAGSNYALLFRSKRHDYFTSCRPWPQKPVNWGGGFSGQPSAPGQGMSFPQSGAPVTGLGVAYGAASVAGPFTVKQSGFRSETWGPSFDSVGTPFRMLADSTSGFAVPDIRVLVNDIRTATLIQQLMERNARGGTRYAEIVRSHFGVMSPDARLQRPELLGGGRSNVTVNPVAQTSATGLSGGTTVLGELAGVGSAMASNHGFSASFTEHGTIIGMVSMRADLTYQQGVNRMWWRRTQFDFYWPGLAGLGEQAVNRRELFCTAVNTPAEDLAVFGYQERWSEYKYKPSRTSGFMRSSVATPLDMWHLGQLFGTAPTLDSAFIFDNPPIDRALQVDTTESAQFLLDTFFEARLVRPMPVYSLPGLGMSL